GKQLTVGVDQRIEELADRPAGFKPENAKPFRTLIPLSELLSKHYKKAVATKSVWTEFNKLVNEKRSEYDVLLKTPINEIAKITSKEFADIIEKNRAGNIIVKGGYDGVYGVPLLTEEDKKQNKEEMVMPMHVQKGLQDF
ncbi:DNA helicase UvrD, partial [Candidatus Woesearchaeota archaeon CG10_big_fil_rev_8_21_14_0_10_34_8]